MNNNPYLKTELKYFLHTFNRQPLLLERGDGAIVWDEKGRKYFDFYSGLAVCGVGHNSAPVVRAAQRQTKALLHSSNFFYTRPQINAARALTSRWKGSRVFFCNSGSEANEGAVKLARLWAHEKKKPGRTIITFKNSFHGRTLAMTSATGWPASSKKMFEPLPAGFKTVPYNNPEKLRKAVDKNTLAIMIEPVQGEGGINVLSEAQAAEIKSLQKKKGILLICDEIQTGMGRTGQFFGFEHFGLKPDIVTAAKGLAGGFPLGAVLCQPKISKLVKPGLHGSTFGGNPVSCAASLEVLKMLSASALKRIRRNGSLLQSKLAAFLTFPSVVEIRGLGLLQAIELNTDGAPYVSLARERGLLINCTQGRVLRFLPPYFMSEKEIDACLDILFSVFKSLSR